MSMDKDCKIVEEQVTETVCVTVMDKLVEEVGYMFKLGEVVQTLFFISFLWKLSIWLWYLITFKDVLNL